MALRPPKDFSPPPPPPRPPSERELRALWQRQESARRERERAGEWRYALENLRRDERDRLSAAEPGGALPTYLHDRLGLGPHARAALRPLPRAGRVAAAGVDTWSPSWYAEPGSPLAAAMRALATEPARRAWLLPEPLGAYRVGWFADSGLVFAEGRPQPGALTPAAGLPASHVALQAELRDVGIPVDDLPSAGLRRLDVGADLCTDSSLEGLALLEGLAGASVGNDKLATYRVQHCLESVFVQSPAGRTLARLYDKGAETAQAPRGRWLRFEAQWRFPRARRPAPAELDGAALRERFKRRFASFWAAAGGIRLGGLEAIAERLGAAIDSGQLQPSRARSLLGYLVLRSAAVDQGASRTVYELERECRELGLSISLREEAGRRVDVATALDECLEPGLWE